MEALLGHLRRFGVPAGFEATMTLGVDREALMGVVALMKKARSPGRRPRFGEAGIRQGAMIRAIEMEVGAAVRACVEAGWDVNASSGEPSGNSMLHLAASWGRSEMVPLLLELGAEINRTNLLGETPLHLAAQRADESMCPLLRWHGADPAKQVF